LASSQTRGGLTSWGDTAFYMINKAIDANAKGDYFPVFGICKGFQTLVHHMKQSNAKIFSNIRNLNKVDKIAISPGSENSLIFAGLSEETKKYMQTQPVKKHLFFQIEFN
jgi:gamma-glutamyl-gamma-aminobutyrate hydrolase PuuD